jgi:hypothetical protein
MAKNGDLRTREPEIGWHRERARSEQPPRFRDSGLTLSMLYGGEPERKIRPNQILHQKIKPSIFISN